MKIGRFKFDYKWNYGIGFGRQDLFQGNRFWPWIRVWFLKIHTMPGWGEALQPKHYKGFYWIWELFVHWNLILYRKTFRIGKRYFSVTFPIKIIHY